MVMSCNSQHRFFSEAVLLVIEYVKTVKVRHVMVLDDMLHDLRTDLV